MTTSFPNMSAAEATVLVQGMFDYKTDLTAFKNHLRDFLVQTKQFKTSDNSAMFAEEQAAGKPPGARASRRFRGCSRPRKSTWATTDFGAFREASARRRRSGGRRNPDDDRRHV